MFTTGAGVALPPPSRRAVEGAAKLFDDTINSPVPGAHPGFGSGAGTPSSSSSPRLVEKGCDLFAEPTARAPSLFSTGTGAQVPPISRQAADAVSRLFGDGNSEAGPSKPTGSGFMTGSGRAASLPSKAAMARAMAIFGDTEEATSTTDTSRIMEGGKDRIPYGTPFRPPTSLAPFNCTASPNLDVPASFSQAAAKWSGHPARLATPSRPPLRTTTNLLSQNHTTDDRKNISTIDKTPAPSRRIGLGATPHASRVKTKSGFTTPFKTPVMARIRATSARTLPVGSPAPHPGDNTYISVFNLNGKCTSEPADKSSARPTHISGSVPASPILRN
jgi:hypothetical protein